MSNTTYNPFRSTRLTDVTFSEESHQGEHIGSSSGTIQMVIRDEDWSDLTPEEVGEELKYLFISGKKDNEVPNVIDYPWLSPLHPSDWSSFSELVVWKPFIVNPDKGGMFIVSIYVEFGWCA